jgi:hypothetical protein
VSDAIRLRQEGLEWRAVEREIVALDSTRSRYLSANRTGAVLWTALGAGATREELADLLVERFDVDVPTALRDVDAFVDALERQGLLAAR